MTESCFCGRHELGPGQPFVSADGQSHSRHRCGVGPPPPCGLSNCKSAKPGLHPVVFNIPPDGEGRILICDDCQELVSAGTTRDFSIGFRTRTMEFNAFALEDDCDADD